jgi:ABC-type branched-subunit amino acid transport system ATPase component
VSFGGLVALRDVAMRVGKGEVFGIIGPNGAGKSTLLNVISRLTKPSAGARMSFGARDLLALRPHDMPRIGLGRTFQSIEISPGGSVIENVMAGAALSYNRAALWAFLGDLADWRQTRELRDTALEHMRRVDIAEFAERPAGDVPYAVKKRLQVCRALMTNPQLLLLDEPASGMDSSEKALLLACLQRLHRTTDLTIVIIEHDVGFLSSFCTSMMALEFGQVIAAGSVADVTNSPEVIAAYLGTD